MQKECFVCSGGQRFTLECPVPVESRGLTDGMLHQQKDCTPGSECKASDKRLSVPISINLSFMFFIFTQSS